jgi:hypothetical protein
MFEPDYKNLLGLFTEHGVEYVVVGAYTMAARGVVRATGDIGLFVRPTAENASAVYGALAEFDAPLAQTTADDFAVVRTVYQTGLVPSRIDILTEIDGVSFDQVGSVMLNVEDLSVSFLNLESLKRNKASTGRAKDMLDLELLKETDPPES